MQFNTFLPTNVIPTDYVDQLDEKLKMRFTSQKAIPSVL